ncbi:hypothetical protein D3C81_237450 [compost metagenome]|jgi:hypothetical protein
MKVANTNKQVKRHIKRSIAANKFAILSVNGVPQMAGGTGLNYSYTVGLSRLGLPELFICGLIPNDVMGGLLKRQANLWIAEGVADYAVRTDVVLRGDVKQDILMRSQCIEISARAAVHQYCSELKQRGGPGLKMAQFLYPDPNNLLPGEEGYDQRYHQPRQTPVLPHEKA